MADQPELPEGIHWPDLTREWWDALGTLDGADEFTVMQWHYLLDTALLHAAVWGNGDFSKHGELGKRMEAFGVTPSSMARLNRSKTSSIAGSRSQRSATTEPAPAPAADVAEPDEAAEPGKVSQIEAMRARMKGRQVG